MEVKHVGVGRWDDDVNGLSLVGRGLAWTCWLVPIFSCLFGLWRKFEVFEVSSGFLEIGDLFVGPEVMFDIDPVFLRTDRLEEVGPIHLK